MTDTVLPHALADLTLDEVVAHWAKATPERPVLEFDPVFGLDPITWGQFEAHVQGCAEGLEDTIAPGEAVGVVCDDSPEFHILVNALWRRSAGILLINRTWGKAVISDLLKLTGCAVLFSPRKDLDAKRYPAFEVCGIPPRSRSSAPISRSEGNSDAIAIYATTSGTTDNPKCVPISHRQIRSAYHSCLGVRDFSSVRKAASLFPLNGIGVLGVCFLLPREIGAATYVFPPFNIATISGSWKNLFVQGVDFVYLVPALVRLLNRIAIPVLRGRRVMAFCAAAPVDENDLRSLERTYPLTVYNVYGLTELTFAVFFGCRAENGGPSNSIGYPLGVEAKILDGEECPVDEGELYLRGPMLTEGYLHNSAATAEMWTTDGWLKTGDLARRDAAGRYYISGRIKEAVIRGASFITYMSWSTTCAKHQVSSTPVLSRRDLPSGDELCAVVHADGNVASAHLLLWIKEHVGEEKVPNVLFVWRRELPRNANGKILRKDLATLYANDLLSDDVPSSIGTTR